jgi:CheY-like chemotaxis protein
MIEIILSDEDLELISVTNSLELFSVIDKEQPDLLLLDLWMPVLNGDQILRELRKHPEYRLLPVVVMSASRDGKEIAEMAGATEYIAKPFELDNFTNVIRNRIKK